MSSIALVSSLSGLRRLGAWRPLVLGVLMASLVLGGCASAKFIPTGETYDPRDDDCTIEVFSSRLPDRAYEELGILEGEGALGTDSLEDILPKMKREACRAGGDAIILTSTQKTGEGFFDDSDEEMHVTATVVRWMQ